ncbi:Molybdenum cofactor sulfurase [Colletotrichum gloeosporioides]|uniref:Molybdenum cofactor sulfurase n=1 Tax=Colletotrichum gloeosporioides TaxID=474922 RepID=A0A8H4CXW9_COLGL|nr:Molybdenum cofactor sulfurase [Colletotrichum gloeosporioides]KAF3812123.1 Molybdenum cofactor sulfurase [Colletotrichum gloeosporioides]
MASDLVTTGLPSIHSTYNARIEAIREDEYPMLKDQVYLDHAGMTVPAKSLMTSFANEMSSTLFEDIRIRVLQMFNADPARFDVVFVANATAGIKLVAEALRGTPEGFDYVYHQWSHTSLVVAFNLKNEHGSWISLADFQKLASLQTFHLRTGSVCNPGGLSEILGLSSAQIKKNYADGFRCGDDNDLNNGQPTGVIRASLGAMSTESDVDRLINFIQEFYVTRSDITTMQDEIQYGQDVTTGIIQDVIVYPIKSCKGFHIPQHTPWQVRPEGLMWDREWCLVHRGTGRALSQKRYPRMALLQPKIDLKNETLSVVYLGFTPHGTPDSVSIPLAEDSDVIDSRGLLEWTVSRICGENVNVQRYISHHITEFFSNALGVPCDLARCSPKIHKAAMRLGKVRRLPKMCPRSAWDQKGTPAPACTTLGTTQHNTKGHPILLSNESPILAVTTSSLEALNAVIRASGGRDVSPDVFRANIVIASSPEASAYSEDDWSDILIGALSFRVLGSCQRCHMVCVDPETGVKGAEPFVSLSKTRRFDGKVWFGVHLTMERHANTGDMPEEDHVVSVGQCILGNSAKSPNLPEST